MFERITMKSVYTAFVDAIRDVISEGGDTVSDAHWIRSGNCSVTQSPQIF